MRIYIVSCVFSPEPIVSARTSRDLAQALTFHGHEVQVITSFPSRPAGKIFEGYHRRLWARKRSECEYEILRVFSCFSTESKVLSRFLENFSFGLSSFLAILLLIKPDVIYANTWPIFAQGLLLLVCKFRRIPLVLSVQDLYPESLVIQKRGFHKKSWFFTFLRWLDGQIARNCAGLIVISEQFKQTYVCDRGIAEHKITVIPNWSEDSPLAASFDADDIRIKHNIPNDAFLVVYGGNIGVAAGVEGLIDAFQFLKQQENIYLLIAGAGSSLRNCSDLICKYQLERVKIHSPWQTSDTFPVLSAADLCILPTQGEQSLVSVPSKLLSYMMAGRCVLALASPESETARIISDSGAGWVISTNNSLTLANTITEISRLLEYERDQRGQAGRRFVDQHFSKAKNLARAVEALVQQSKHNEQKSPYPKKNPA